MSDIFAQTDFRSVELIWYDFRSHGTIFGPWYDFGTIRYDFVTYGTIFLHFGSKNRTKSKIVPK